MHAFRFAVFGLRKGTAEFFESVLLFKINVPVTPPGHIGADEARSKLSPRHSNSDARVRVDMA